MTENARTPLLEVENLEIEIAGPERAVTPVAGISFSLCRGETLAIVGESGCGKSMTALALMRLLPEGARAKGDARIGGIPVLDLPEREMQAVRGRKAALIFQEPSSALNPVMTAGDQIAEVLRHHFGMTKREAREEAVRWLERVGIPEPEKRAGAYPFELSGGQKQRCVIAMALAARPELVIADEPTTALDVTLQKQILELLAKLQAETGMALLLITHDLAVVQRMADRVALMYAGKIVEEAPAKEFFARPLHPYASQLLAAVPAMDRKGEKLASIPGTVPALDRAFACCRFADRCRAASPACRAGEPPMRRISETRRVACFRAGDPLAATGSACAAPAPASGGKTPPETVLSVKNCTVEFPVRGGLFRFRKPGVIAVKNAGLELRAGETLALVGESGSGKTTLGKAILQLFRGSARITGEITVCGTDAVRAKGESLRRLRQSAQMIFQDPFSSLDPRMTVEETLLEPLASLRPEIPAADRKARLLRLMDQAGLPREALSRYPHEFSGGQRQRISIARALAPEPRLIVCDEPTSALDVSVQAQILNLLKDIQRETGVAYLLITHNFGVVEYIADRVSVIERGVIVEAGEAAQVLRSPANPYTRELLASVPALDLPPSRG